MFVVKLTTNPQLSSNRETSDDRPERGRLSSSLCPQWRPSGAQVLHHLSPHRLQVGGPSAGICLQTIRTCSRGGPQGAKEGRECRRNLLPVSTPAVPRHHVRLPFRDQRCTLRGSAACSPQGMDGRLRWLGR